MSLTVDTTDYNIRLLKIITTNLSICLITLAVLRIFMPVNFLFEQILCLSALISTVQLLSRTLISRQYLIKTKLSRYFLGSVTEILVPTLFSLTIISTFLLNVDRSRSFSVLYCVDQGLVKVDKSGNLVSSQNYERSIDKAIIARLLENKKRNLISESLQFQLELTAKGDFVLTSGLIAAEIFNLEGWREIRKEIDTQNFCENT